MSYDLLFKPRKRSFNQVDLSGYFSRRHNYKINRSQAIYGNEDTGVYFQFDAQAVIDGPDEEHYSVAFSINYFRPSYFILEAEPEVTAFIQEFELEVSDPQIGGMGEGEYRSDLLVSGWNVGNKVACATLLREPSSRQDLLSLPTATLLQAWEWNYKRKALQEQAGERQFVPRIMMVCVDGKPSTAAVWPDAIPSVLPVVEHLIVARQEFAPKRFFRAAPDRVLLPWRDAVSILSSHSSLRSDNMISLAYERRPKDVIDFIRSMPASKQEIVIVTADKVLDRELVESALA